MQLSQAARLVEIQRKHTRKSSLAKHFIVYLESVNYILCGHVRPFIYCTLIEENHIIELDLRTKLAIQINNTNNTFSAYLLAKYIVHTPLVACNFTPDCQNVFNF